jgi:hypothetical protein
MAYRLDYQRPPAAGKTHKRLNARNQTRGYMNGVHATWGDTQRVSALISDARPADAFPVGYPTIVASDATNAARLGPLGFVANPTTNWTTGQAISVMGFNFNWNGSAWAAGTHA